MFLNKLPSVTIWEKHVGFGIRKKTIGHSKSILRGFLSAAGLSFWWEAGKNGDNRWNKARKWGGGGGELWQWVR